LPDRAKDRRTERFDAADEAAAEVARRLDGRHALVLTDFDGTLAELVPMPGDAKVSEHVRGALDSLAALPHLTLGVVSGRLRQDVVRRVGPAAEYAAGLHGLEISGPSVRFRHQALNEVEPIIARIAADAARRLAWCPGCFLENKHCALTCHVRLTPSELAEQALEEFEAIAEPYLEARVLRLLTGSKAMELLPAVDWHKGRAVDWIRARVAARLDRPVSVLYLGDDRTDEDAFTGLRDDDFAIGVGDRPHTHMIDARLEGPPAVGQFFSSLETLRRD